MMNLILTIKTYIKQTVTLKIIARVNMNNYNINQLILIMNMEMEMEIENMKNNIL